MEQSKQQLAERVTEAMCRCSTMAQLWTWLGELAARYGQSPDVFSGWLDRLLEQVAYEYGVPEEERGDLQTIRELALDPGEGVSEAAMELLLAQGKEAVDEIVAILRVQRSNMSGRTPVLRIKKLHADARAPQQATEGASGLDLFAYIEQESGRVMLEEKPKLIGTGIAVEVPRGYDMQIRPRSGLSAKGIMVAFGTVDSDYRGEVMVTMYALGQDASFEVKHGDRIAQLVVGNLADLPIEEAKELSSTERGPQGHGSTGMA